MAPKETPFDISMHCDRYGDIDFEPWIDNTSFYPYRSQGGPIIEGRLVETFVQRCMRRVERCRNDSIFPHCLAVTRLSGYTSIAQNVLECADEWA